MRRNITLSLDPFLARKIEVVAQRRGLKFCEALFFLLWAVITPPDKAKKGA